MDETPIAENDATIYRAEGYPVLVLTFGGGLALPPTMDLFDAANDRRVTFTVDPDARVIPPG